MDDTLTTSSHYKSLETLLVQRNPIVRAQQLRERELKEQLDSQGASTLMSEKTTLGSDRTRTGSSVKSTSKFNRNNIEF